MRKIHLVESTMSGGEEGGNLLWVESTMSSKGGGRLEKWPYLADKCRALRNNYKLGPFLTKTPRCLGFLVFHILWSEVSQTRLRQVRQIPSKISGVVVSVVSQTPLMQYRLRQRSVCNSAWAVGDNAGAVRDNTAGAVSQTPLRSSQWCLKSEKSRATGSFRP